VAAYAAAGDTADSTVGTHCGVSQQLLQSALQLGLILYRVLRKLDALGSESHLCDSSIETGLLCQLVLQRQAVQMDAARGCAVHVHVGEDVGRGGAGHAVLVWTQLLPSKVNSQLGDTTDTV
jgi:hypothetical protein